MYYEECIKNGALCYRTTPDGEWNQKTPEQLTEMLIEARRKANTMPTTPVQNHPTIVYQPVFMPQQPSLVPPYTVTC